MSSATALVSGLGKVVNGEESSFCSDTSVFDEEVQKVGEPIFEIKLGIVDPSDDLIDCHEHRICRCWDR